MPGVLDGIRVLDFGRYTAGLLSAALLAALGADVVRVEKVRGSEDRFLVPLTAAGDGALFMQVNRNKRGLTLNPMKPEAREVVQRLAATADVVVANPIMNGYEGPCDRRRVIAGRRCYTRSAGDR